MKRIYAALALTVTLLLTQLGGVGHALSHYGPGEDKERPHSVCQLCVAYAALDHAVAATGHPPQPPQVSSDPAGGARLGRQPAPVVHYLGRAPPRLAT